MTRPKLLDLFCCEGGAGMGYHRAGFDVTGVDITPQPRYPFKFIQADALEYLAEHGSEFDAIHASPPCQRYSALAATYAEDADPHPDLVDPTRAAIEASGRPWLMENVPGAPMPAAVVLCGSMFGLGSRGHQLRRHRLFEHHPDVAAWPPYTCQHTSPVVGIYGDHARSRSHRKGGDFPDRDKIAIASEALGIDWMSWRGLSQSIPPAYTEWLGAALLDLTTASRRVT